MDWTSQSSKQRPLGWRPLCTNPFENPGFTQ